jgi:hypothetical protein
MMPSHHSLMMEAERASETLDCSSILTRLVTREYFIANINWLSLFKEIIAVYSENLMKNTYNMRR